MALSEISSITNRTSGHKCNMHRIENNKGEY